MKATLFSVPNVRHLYRLQIFYTKEELVACRAPQLGRSIAA